MQIATFRTFSQESTIDFDELRLLGLAMFSTIV